ncbi:MAG: hypothetical protein A3I77_01695 [Gammaproteobacteria bacterium RIFCSPLOWO2_02_FULL_42_14]|nr:MAG: hypothetical protein A3B71_07880 [Gammaproteobacteria bacterium RIFCSPHIGHO2_02_FULL_42_43]OGT28258.1 MAG: hypothetical protein A2624_02205 [Gammaproteobacteria bacterium RIFCSPHIGHO2_01_FULL_42_8]OGT52336.1 MAG: hypothetical protein A3E54_01760 [Gammaproteobacteria bacterium RIFCSPHIGHO2_12_FULL_41_25]OGT61947.1 MAG: hypothetical protein A3I77_01695 [Gammaproteobacteria bacterium RIFCSPLOWO2_02_FULL_42_14]OGT86341.1 MAG: hypothetical protein A3G86_07395 [Gammaproteobacteria bacterium R
MRSQPPLRDCIFKDEYGRLAPAQIILQGMQYNIHYRIWFNGVPGTIIATFSAGSVFGYTLACAKGELICNGVTHNIVINMQTGHCAFLDGPNAHQYVLHLSAYSPLAAPAPQEQSPWCYLGILQQLPQNNNSHILNIAETSQGTLKILKVIPAGYPDQFRIGHVQFHQDCEATRIVYDTVTGYYTHFDGPNLPLIQLRTNSLQPVFPLSQVVAPPPPPAPAPAPARNNPSLFSAASTTNPSDRKSPTEKQLQDMLDTLLRSPVEKSPPMTPH